MALNSLFCADVPLSNYSLTHSQYSQIYTNIYKNIQIYTILCTYT